MQALYAYFQMGSNDMHKAEKELLNSINRVYDLYIYMLLLLVEIRDQAVKITSDAKNKRLPSESDLNPNTRFIENSIFNKLSENKQFKREVINRKITWQTDDEFVRKILSFIKASEEYEKYMHTENYSFEIEKEFIVSIFKNQITNLELLEHFFEEKSIYWVDDLRIVSVAVIKTIESFAENINEDDFILLPLFKDEDDDRKFAVDLFRKTINNDIESEKVISQKTMNWEIERIAMMDILLMKMAITEILHFSQIPIKVTLNEYIEISKLYSSPKSKLFINGILDKLVSDFKSEKKILKSGRGLAE